VSPPKTIRIDPELWPISGEVEAVEVKPVTLSPEATEAATEKGEGKEKAGAKAKAK